MAQEDHQLGLSLGGAAQSGMVKTTRARNKRRVVPRPQPTELPLKERRFLPVVGVPKTRGECPEQRPCPHVQCRHHLWRIDACDRAGRPGLASVPRDEHGRTLAQEGDAGKERAGTTLWPAWLELERTCMVVLVRDDEGRVVGCDTYTSTTQPVGTWELFRQYTHDGEPIEVLDEEGRLCGAAVLTPEGIRFRHLIGGYVVTLRRMRGVPCCALDEADRGPRSNEQVGDATGRHRTLAARVIRGGLIKMRAAGVDVRDLIEEEPNALQPSV